MAQEMTERNEVLAEAYATGNYTLQQLGNLAGCSRERIRQVIMHTPAVKMANHRKKLRRANATLIRQLKKEHGESHKVYQRFWNNVDKQGEDDCWNWIGHIHPVNGYGRMHPGALREYGLTTQPELAHRISWCIHNASPIPAGLWILHTCDNPACVNPAHLYLGTPADNVRDRDERSGWGGFTQKLSDDEVKSIENVFDQEGIDCVHRLSEAYGVTAQYIYMLGKRNAERNQ